MLGGMLGDERLQVGDLLAHRAVLRVVADAAAVAHRECVLPGRQQGLELGAEGFEIHWDLLSAAPADRPEEAHRASSGRQRSCRTSCLSALRSDANATAPMSSGIQNRITRYRSTAAAVAAAGAS